MAESLTMNVPIEVALGDGDPPSWSTVHVKAGIDRVALARRCSLLLNVDPEEFTTVVRADRSNSGTEAELAGTKPATVFVQPFAKFLLVRKGRRSPCPLTVLACGDDTSAQLGRKAKALNAHEPLPVPGLLGRRVVQVAAGEAHSAFVLQNGALLTCGKTSLGRLGLGQSCAESSDVQQVPRRVEFPVRSLIVKTCCSATRTYCITNDGRVFVFGEAGAGLGLGSKSTKEDHVYSPILLTTVDEPVKACSASNSCVIAITLTGRGLFRWGDECEATLPLKTNVDSSIPCAMEVAVGHSTSHLALLAFEDGSFGEVTPRTGEVRPVIGIRNNSSFTNYSIACSVRQSFICKSDGELLTIPSGMSFNEPDKVRRVNLRRGGHISGVFASPHANHTVVIAEDGRPFGWGESGKGQLTLIGGDIIEPAWLGGALDCVESVALGSAHTLLLYSSYVSPFVQQHETVEQTEDNSSDKTRSLMMRESCAGIPFDPSLNQQCALS